MNKTQKEENIRQLEEQLFAAVVAHNEASQWYDSAVEVTLASRQSVLDYVQQVGGEKAIAKGEDLAQATKLEEEARTDLNQAIKTREEKEDELSALKGQLTFDFAEPPEPEALAVSPDAIVDEIDMTVSAKDAFEKTVSELAKGYRKQPLKELRRLKKKAKERYEHLVEEIHRFDAEIATALTQRQEVTASTLKMERRYIAEAMTDASVDLDAICEALENRQSDPSAKSAEYMNQRKSLVASLIAAAAVIVLLIWRLGPDSTQPAPSVPAQMNTVAEANQELKAAPPLPLEPLVHLPDDVTVKAIAAAKRLSWEEAEVKGKAVLLPWSVVPPEDTLRCSGCLRAVQGLGQPGRERVYCTEFCS